MADTQLNTAPKGALATPSPAMSQARNVIDLYDPARFAGIGVLATNIVNSKLYGNVTKEQAFVILQTGMELGIPPTAAMQGIHVIQGKGAMAGQLMVALVQRAGHRFEILENTDERAVCRLTRGDTKIVRNSVYTVEDAKKAGLVGKDNWVKFRRAMILNRCISECCRYGAPDVLGGMIYTPEDFGSTVVPGGVVLVEQVDPPTTQTAAPPPGLPPVSEMVEQSGEDDIWVSLFETLKKILTEAGTEKDKYDLKVAEWSGHYAKDRSKAIPGLTKYINTLKAALEKKKHTAKPDAPTLDEAMKAHLLKSGVPEANVDEFLKGLIDGWIEEDHGDLGAVDLRKMMWLQAEGAETPQHE